MVAIFFNHNRLKHVTCARLIFFFFFLILNGRQTCAVLSTRNQSSLMWHPFDKRSYISALLIDLEFNTTFTVHPLSNIISVRKHLPSWWKQKVNLNNERNSPLKTHFRRSFMSTCSCDKSSKNSATLEWNKTNHEMKVKCYLQIKWCYKHEINTAAPPTWLDVSPFSLPLWTLPILLFPWALKSRERTSTSHCTGDTNLDADWIDTGYEWYWVWYE